MLTSHGPHVIIAWQAGSGAGSSVAKDREGGERALTSITRNLPEEGTRCLDTARLLLSAPMVTRLAPEP